MTQTQTKTYIEVSKEWGNLDDYLFIVEHCGQRGIITCEYQPCDEEGRTVNRDKADYFMVGFRKYYSDYIFGKQTRIMVLPTDVVTLKVDRRYGA